VINEMGVICLFKFCGYSFYAFFDLLKVPLIYDGSSIKPMER